MGRPLTTAYVGIASDVDSERNVVAALGKLAEAVRVTGVSTFYYTPPLKRPDDPPFANGVARIETDMGAGPLKFDLLRRIESDLGRVRPSDPYGPRTIDIDLLLYGTQSMEEPDLRVPDPDIRTRAFVARALVELDAELVMPDTGERVGDFVDEGALSALRPALELTARAKEIIRDGS